MSPLAEPPVGNAQASEARSNPTPPPGASTVIVQYLDGRRLQGYTLDFDANKPGFHLHEADNPSKEGLEVWMKGLKAVFFVKDFAGQSGYSERKEFCDGETPPAARKMRVEFLDGEVLAGYTMGYHPSRQGFFFFPVDPASNNLRVFALVAATKRVDRL